MASARYHLFCRFDITLLRNTKVVDIVEVQEMAIGATGVVMVEGLILCVRARRVAG
jgi:hypothetical protein